MRFFLDFLKQKVPKQGKEIPAYYRRALFFSEILLVVYFAVCFFLFPIINGGRWEWIPVLFIGVTAAALYAIKHQGVRINLILYALLCFGWVFWNVQHFGWSSGVQHFLTLMVVLVFFNVYDRPLYKIIWLLVTLAFRIFLFSLSQQVPAIYTMAKEANTVYQTLNTVAFFLMLAGMCVVFSTSIQDTERQLRLKNQTLYKEAGTDALTGLPNRRSLIEEIENHYKNNSNEPFCVAIADIDHFKNVNDTWGHNCGDYTLVKLTELFVAHSLGRYTVCRWGGEEFCFFIPNMNLDEAGNLMRDVAIAVERMPLEYEGNEFSITITIGVEEYDFASPLEDLLNAADEKLYMGKNAGRNRVVV